MNEPTVSVAICAFDLARWDDLVAAVSSVNAQSSRPDELIVVIDHNDELLERANSELQATVVASVGTRGLSGARNTATHLARGEVLAFLDDDATAEPDWLATLCKHFTDDSVHGVGGRAEPNWDSGRPAWFPGTFGWVIGCSYEGMPITAAPIRNLMGCNMAFRTAVLRSSGGFREDLGRVGRRPVGNEETELCIRVRQQEPQGVFVYEPAALVHHRVRDARATWRYFAERCWAEGISKSATVGYVGAEDGLASERTQLLQVLPRAVRRGPASETVAIGIGVACTGAGYVSGRARRRLARLSARREGGER